MARTVTRTQIFNSVGHEFIVDNFGNITDWDTLGVNLKVDSYVTYGSNIPNYKKVIASGNNATTSLEARAYGVTCKPTFAVSGINGTTGFNLPYGTPVYWQVSFQNRLLSFGSPLDSVSELKADNLAKTKFVSRAREVQTTFQGGVALGEIGETIALIKSPAKSLVQGLTKYLGALKKKRRYIRKSPLKKRLRVAKDILADTWLEYSFGWKPLLSDIDDAAKTLAEQQAGTRSLRKMVVAIGSDENEELINGPFTVYSSGPVRIQGYNYMRQKISVKYYGLVDVVLSKSVNWRQSGFSLDNVIPTVWELIPYSFLIDYFSNVGDIISAASFYNTGVRWISKTTVNETFNTLRGMYLIKDSNPDVIRYYSLSPGEEEWYKKTISRGEFLGSLVPTLEFQVPGYGTRWLNIAALAFGSRKLSPYHRTD